MEAREIRIINNKQHQIVSVPYTGQTEEEIRRHLQEANLRHATRNETDTYLEELSKEYDTGIPHTILGFETDGSLCQTVKFLEEKEDTKRICVVMKAGKSKDFIGIGFWEEIGEMIPKEDYLGVVSVKT